MYHYGQTGPGGGSIPEFVMRTGSITPFNPLDARQDIRERSVERATRVPVGLPPGGAQYSPPSGALRGTDAFGRAVREFRIPGIASSAEATMFVKRAKEIAARFRGLGLPREARLLAGMVQIFGAPVLALARGETIVLRWRNGVATQAAL